MENKELKPVVGLKLENTAAKIKVNKLNILKGITKTVTNTLIKNLDEVPNNLIDTVFGSFKFKKTPEGLGYQLIYHALVKALIKLLSETRYKYEENDIEIYHESFLRYG